MTAPNPNIPALDHAAVETIAARVLERGSVKIDSWTLTPIAHIVHSSTNGGIWRLTGVAHIGGPPTPFAAVLKILQTPEGRLPFAGRFAEEGGDGDPGHRNYWRREFEVYRSGLLTNLPEPLRAPRCYGVSERPDGTLWLWIEAMDGAAGATWTIERYADAAAALGVFGAYAPRRPLPEQPWLSRTWLRQWVNGMAANVDLLCRVDLWALPSIREVVPDPPIARILRAWNERERLLAVLERMPRTLCHFDAHALNLFVRPRANGSDELVAIDWAFVGPGVVGQDLAGLVHMSVLMSTGRSLTITAADAVAVEAVAWPAYLNGLLQAGWTGDERCVRFAYAAHASLQCLFIGNLLRQAADPTIRRMWDERSGRSFEWRIRARMQHTLRLLDLADEARRLLPDVESMANA